MVNWTKESPNEIGFYWVWKSTYENPGVLIVYDKETFYDFHNDIPTKTMKIPYIHRDSQNLLSGIIFKYKIVNNIPEITEEWKEAFENVFVAKIEIPETPTE